MACIVASTPTSYKKISRVAPCPIAAEVVALCALLLDLRSAATGETISGMKLTVALASDFDVTSCPEDANNDELNSGVTL